MEQLKQVVHSLLSDGKNAQHYLQKLNEFLLKDYKIVFRHYLSIIPLEVEIFYANFQSIPQFVDISMHCVSAKNGRILGTNEFWELQSNRFGKLYFHLKGAGGIDICLSDSKEYALCMTVKGALINGEEIIGRMKIAQCVIQVINENEKITDQNDMISLINNSNPEQYIVKNDVSQAVDCVYHAKRKLPSYDKNASLLLHSFADVWDEKVSLTNSQRISLYMTAHPNEDIIAVMKEHQFRFIPTDVRLKYNISHKIHL